MNNQLPNQPVTDIGLAIVLMEDRGPQTALNLSSLSEISSMYLAVKGFTAFMTGFERDKYGPGKIRGILEIPESNKYAVALDINMRGTGFEEDDRLQKSRIGVFCLIANEDQLTLIRKYYRETEEFLIERLKAVASINHLNESFCQRIIKDYNLYLAVLETKHTEQEKKEREEYCLFEVDVLLSLPKEENITARIILEKSSGEQNGITLSEIIKQTNIKKKNQQRIIDKLLEKGLIFIITPRSAKDEIRYIAK
jgi:DNA-binding MarR family transcriptional regulator